MGVLGIRDRFSIEGYRRVSDATFSLLSGLTCCSWADAMESEDMTTELPLSPS